MLQVHILRNNRDLVLDRLRKRMLSKEGLDLVDQAIRLDDRRKELQHDTDQLLAEKNKKSKEIGALLSQGKKEAGEAAKQAVKALKSEIDKLESEAREIKEKLETTLLDLPNIPHETVPMGSSEEDNEVYQAWEGDFPQLPENALPHWELAAKYNLIDFELGAKITGSGFPLYRGKGAKLERALISFFLDEAEAGGYEEIIPPLVVNEASARATGQLPDKEGQMYHITEDQLYMIPTAEVPITNIYRNQILQISDFPIKLTGYTPCFRREAGSYGSDVKGLNRVHQFDKVEIVRIEHPDQSYQVLHEMLEHVGGILDKLELPYRILRLCGGDLGFTSALTFDFEVYSSAQQKWLEVSSVSNFESYQANRLKLRYKDEAGQSKLAHTLNGSALALARIVAAILENYQTEDGINIPRALIPYTKFERIE